MNNRTQLLLSTFKPKLAVMVYKDDRNDYYLESHTVDEQGNIMEGKPLLQETLNDIVDVFFDEKKNMTQVKGMVPENLLEFDLLPGGNYRMIWYRPAEIKFMHFDPQLKIKSAQSWVPAMVYCVERNDLSIYALKTNTRPKEITKIFRAPFHNTSNDGSVCLGDARVKKPTEKTYLSLMKYWEDLFWLSEFTHLNGADNHSKTEVNALWRKLVASKTKLKFDTNELMPYKNKTIKTLLR